MPVERFYILAPALLGVVYLLVALAAYSVLCATGRTPQVEGLDRRRFTEIFGPFLVRYMLWLIRPVEKRLVGRVSPNAITLVSLAACAAAGATAALGLLASAAWLYAGAGIFDILDGRLARATGRQTKAGALFDSVSDRWGELFLFTGLAWYLRESTWLLVVMLAVAGSMMVSYTRARGEGLGLQLDGGTMQRAERIVLLSVGMFVAAWLAVGADTSRYAVPVVGWSLLIVGAASTATAVGRWVGGYRELISRQPEEQASPAPVRPAPAEPRRTERPREQRMRVPGEHTA